MGDEATKWFLRHHFRNHGLTVLRYFLKQGFIETLVKAYDICVTMVAQGHRHQLSIPQLFSVVIVDPPGYENALFQGSKLPLIHTFSKKDYLVLLSFTILK